MGSLRGIIQIEAAGLVLVRLLGSNRSSKHLKLYFKCVYLQRILVKLAQICAPKSTRIINVSNFLYQQHAKDVRFKNVDLLGSMIDNLISRLWASMLMI